MYGAKFNFFLWHKLICLFCLGVDESESESSDLEENWWAPCVTSHPSNPDTLSPHLDTSTHHNHHLVINSSSLNSTSSSYKLQAYRRQVSKYHSCIYEWKIKFFFNTFAFKFKFLRKIY